jgi:tetratricopeptide (TPR) repeat protein
MNKTSDHFDLPPWASLGLRLVRGLVGAAAILLTGFILLELMAYHFFPGRSTRFLLEGVSDGKPAWIDNQFFPYRFFSERTARAPLPIVALKTPPAANLRVCLLGGSEAMGAPDPSFGLGRQLELMLQSRYPDHPVEVIHMALDGGNSHVLREAARDLKQLKPNAVIVLTGNNEVAGPYGPASGLGRFHHSVRIARWMSLFSRTRLSQLCIAAINKLFPARADLNAWRSQEPITLNGRMAPQDPRLNAVFLSFRQNLAAILREASEASPVVVVCTVPVNLRDCAPFSTSFLDDETAAQRVRETLRAAIAAETATNRIEAARLYADTIRRDPTHAEALFRAGRMALRENRTAEAAALFSRARDSDALRLRADSRINSIIRECAVQTSVSLFDAEALFAIRSPQGIPGRELFLDHIHFTFEANHLLASSLLDRLEFLRAFEPEPTGSIPGPESIASELLYDPWGRDAQLGAMINQQLRPPFRRQLDNAETIARLNEEKKLWDARVDAISPANTCAVFSRRQSSRPDDAWLAARAAWYLLNADDPVRAEAAALSAYQHWPHRFDIRALLALIRAEQGQAAANGIAFIRGSGSNSGYYDIDLAIGIGRELLKKKRYAEARLWLEFALRRDSWNSEAAISLADTLHHLDDGARAVEILQSAIERNPRNPLLWEEIASLYCLLGNWDTATRCFRKSEEIAPYRYERLLKWADALVRLKQYSRARGPIGQYLAAMPDDPEGLALQAQINANLPPKPEPPPEPAADKSSRKFPWE